MKKRNNLNLYLPIILVIIFFVFIFLERIYTNNIFGFDFNKNDSSLTMLSDEEWQKYNQNKNINYNEKSLIIYDRKSVYSIDIKNNIKYVMSTISVKSYVKDINELNKNEDLSKYDTIVVCVQDLEQLSYSASDLMEYVSNGGGILFAIDLVESENFDNYYKLLGIEGNNGYADVKSLIFNDNFLINSKGKEYGELVITANVLNFDLNDSVNIHVSSNDDNNVPLIWNLKYGKGYVGVANNGLLSSKNGRGLIVSLYSSIHDVFAYPVINSAVYFIDDFPSPIPNGYDDIITSEYGYTIKDFYSNVWWPTMYDITTNKGIKFSAYIIQTYEDNVNGSFDNFYFQEESQYYINQILAVGGEMGIHGYNHQPLVVNDFYYGEDIVYNMWPSPEKAIESIKSIVKYTEEMVGKGKVISYVPPSNILSEELYLKMQEKIPEIKIYASLYVGDGSTLDQEFDVLDNGTVNVPRLYSGMVMSEESDYMLINELSYHYVFSHFMHPDDILDVERRSEKGFGYMTEKYIELIDFVNSTNIRNTTISEAAAAIERYQITSVNKEYKNNKLILKVSGIYDEVSYFLKTNGKTIKNVNGCKYKEIAENYYLLTIDSELVEIEME